MIDLHYFVLHFIQGGLGGIPGNNANDKPNEPLVGKPNEPSLSAILMDHQLSPLTVSPNKPLAESLDPVNPIDPLTRMNPDRTENHLANSVNLLKPLTANGPTGEERLERLNPINSKDPNGLN